MSTEMINDRISIKNLLFTKALPNHTIPVPTDGYETFPCIDCGDKFLFETSYTYHTNRKSLKIVYYCRYCNNIRVFYNRCKFLSHLRSHGFTTATINVSDLKLEPLPIEDFRMSVVTTTDNDQILETQTFQKDSSCYECHEITNKCGAHYKNRVEHYMHYSMKSFSCPICLFLLPTICALEAHLRIHLKVPPYFCPECGILLPHRSLSYPFNHECEGFKMMKAAVRIKCNYNNCNEIFHPNEYRTHLKTHFQKIYKCLFCLETWTNKPEAKCTRCNNILITCLQCPICTNKLFSERRNIERHLNSHSIDMVQLLNIQVYPCKNCNVVCKNMHSLLHHYIQKHKVSTLENLLCKITERAKSNKIEKSNRIAYDRVIKRCKICLRSFVYRITSENVKTLPNNCPYKCSIDVPTVTNEKMQIQCPLCNKKITENWSNIKIHFATFHKSHKCLDLTVMVKKININIGLKLKRKSLEHIVSMRKTTKVSKVHTGNAPLNAEKSQEISEISTISNICNICKCNCENKNELESHFILHRDPLMAYQCLECGECFVVKTSFSIHLLLEHGIPDVEAYIVKKPCYNEFAMIKNQNPLNIPADEPVQENQCRICREQFTNDKDLEKHFRVHGMAFLMKNTLRNNTTESNC